VSEIVQTNSKFDVLAFPLLFFSFPSGPGFMISIYTLKRSKDLAT
jgi:hypothetical protein